MCIKMEVTREEKDKQGVENLNETQCLLSNQNCVGQSNFFISGRFRDYNTFMYIVHRVMNREKVRVYGPFITYKITPAGSLSSSQPGRPPCWASPLAFGLIGHEHTVKLVTVLKLFE